MSDPIVDRVDALVRKRRSFVASATATAESREPRESPAVDEDDVPLLTEIVDLAAAAAEAPGTAAPRPLQPRLDRLATDLSRMIEERLAADLPGIVQGVMEQLHADLRRGIFGSIESATRDFIARRQQLRLPFPEPSDD